MKLKDTISWLMGRVQRSLFPHLNHCLPTPLTEQEERLVSILEIAQIERYLPKNIAMVEKYLSQELIGHISRDSTAIAGREKPAKKIPKEPRIPKN